MGMTKITFLPNHVTIEVPLETTILAASRQAGVLIESPCNGVGTCGKCKVRLQPQEQFRVIQAGVHHLSAEEAAQGFVLSCETKVIGDITVEVINKQEENETLKILQFGKSFDIEVHPLIRKLYSAHQETTLVFAGNRLLGEEPGNTTEKLYGLSVDIGTTTLVVSLVDLNSGEEIHSESALNPQSLHAQDVLSRIKFASDEEGLHTMYTDLIQELNQLISKVVQVGKVDPANIYEAIFSGNTCMIHLATKVDPRSLGQYPYIPKLTGDSLIPSAELGLNIADFGLVYLPPIISAYVGPDITSGVLAANLPTQSGVTLFVDIGTNGEMVIGQDGQLSATSTAAGPAFEGMNITHGMRAGVGAIEYFNVEEDGSIIVKTIGDAEATGICGSGLLDIVGELVAHGVINKSGRFVDADKVQIPANLQERLVKVDGKPAFQVAAGVYLTQKDVRQVQLAKGAIRAGIEFLLKAKAIKSGNVHQVLIAGSFGYHLRAKSLINIGLLPEEFQGKIEFIGNTSKSGGQAFLVNHGYRNDMKKVVDAVEVVELANYQDFDKVFVACLGF